MTDAELFEHSFNIAWNVLERTGELGEPAATTRFLGERIAGMMSAANVPGYCFQNSQ
jgi:hypothetical protein